MHKVFAFIKLWIFRPWNWFKKLSIKRKIITIFVLIIAISVASQVISTLTKPAPYTTEKVRLSNITESVTESGNISTSGLIEVYSPSNGVITESYVENGMAVEDGEKLFVVKSSATEQEEKAAQANYLAAVNSLNTAQASANTLRASMYGSWETFRNLATNSTYEKGDDTPNEDNRKATEFQVAQDTWLASEKEYKDQQTTIAQAQAAVASTHALFMATQDATVTAPASGVVTNLSLTRGSIVSIKTVSLTGENTKPSLILMSDYQNEIVVKLSETDVSKVMPGQKATISISAIPNKEYNGRVERVDSVGTDVQGVVTYNSYVSLLDADTKIKQGMTVDVDITTEELKNVLSVSNSSVKPYQGGRAVRIPDKSKPEKFKYVPVVIGIRGDEKTQILKGVSEGQEVIKTLSNESIQRPGLFGN